MAFATPASIRPPPTTVQSTPNLKSVSRPISISRRSTLKRSIDDSSLAPLSSSPSKKHRVKFDADVDIVSADDDDDLDPLVVKEQVRRAIERHYNHDSESYERIKSVFGADSDKESSPSTRILKTHLLALEANISRLGKQCGSLVQAVIQSEWVGKDDNYVTLFVRFLGNLAVAQGGYINSIIGMLVDLLGTEKTRRLPGMRTVRQPKIHKRVLEAIKYITQLIPLASTTLSQRIATKLDFEFKKVKDSMAFVQNFMLLIKYTPEVTSDILNNILRQLIKLDTSIQVELEEDDDELEEDILQHMSSSQTLAYVERRRSSETSTDDNASYASSSEEEDSEDEEDADPAVERRKKLKEHVRHVDMIMDILFEYYAELISTNNLEARDNAVEQLIAQFNNLILPTYRSRHPQFLIFHFAQSDPARVDRFVTNCISILLDSHHSPALRQTAAAYFSGFVGRGNNVSPALVHDCLDLLCDQLNEFRAKHEKTCFGPNLKRYGDFYAMFQAVMYIFCFRWRDLSMSTLDDDQSDDSDSEDDDTAIPKKPYQLPHAMHQAIYAAIYSPLNPLRICTPDIVAQFAKLAMSLELFYLYPKIEENKRVRVTSSWHSIANIDLNGSSSGADRDMSWLGDNGTLEGFFPFDPYHLPISKHWIEGDYVEWRGIPGEEDEDSDSDSEAEYDDTDVDDDYDMLDDVVDRKLDSSDEE